MRPIGIALSGIALLAFAVAPTAAADSGVGVCVDGRGTDVVLSGLGTLYVGVVAGPEQDGPVVTIHSSPSTFEEYCCAQAGEGPDCFV